MQEPRAPFDLQKIKGFKLAACDSWLKILLHLTIYLVGSVMYFFLIQLCVWEREKERERFWILIKEHN